MQHTPHTHHDPFDQGLAHDLNRLLAQQAARRTSLRWLLGAGGLALVGGGGGDSISTGTSTGAMTGGTTTTTSGSCSVIPSETEGPYPGDGSNTANGSIANVLTLSGIVRQDIRTSIGNASGTAGGVPMTVELELVNTNASCAVLSGYAIYLWHCDALGRYSMYSSGATAENYLRGVQVTGSNGKATFTTIVPGCYAGRWPHMHFEIYRSSNTASSYTNKLRTSQLAVPEDICTAVYATSGYSGSATNLRGVSLASDGIFSFRCCLFYSQTKFFKFCPDFFWHFGNIRIDIFWFG
jgi:protocatechuate 3,4-dioxygenase beta subunit